jgi:hypothetical protein
MHYQTCCSSLATCWDQDQSAPTLFFKEKQKHCYVIKVLKSSSRLPSSPRFTGRVSRSARSAAFARFRAPLGIFVKKPFIVSKLQRGPTAPTLTGPLPLLFPRVALPALSPRGPPPLHFSQSTPTPAPPRPDPRNSASLAPPRGSMD